jgi:hypothetical protein
MPNLHVQIPQELYKEIESRQKDTGLTKAEITRRALTNQLDL